MTLLADLARVVVPAGAKRRLKNLHRDYVLGQAVKELATCVERGRLEASTARRLIYGWGNEGFSAEPDLLFGIFEHALRTSGPILECGAGLSTIMLGLIAKQRSIRVWSLDHEDGWVRTVERSLLRFGIDSVQVLHAPLGRFDGFEWYETPQDVLPRGFALVICDGPPGSTEGGRYGLLPRLREHLGPGCVVLLDDAAREGERSVLERWSREFGVFTRLEGTVQPFAEVLLPH